jgi:hypothetical protein
VSRLSWTSETACTIVCTDQGTHPERRLGEVDAAGNIATISGPHGRRPSSPTGRGVARDPEPCPSCDRNIRKSREWWQQTVARANAARVDVLDISYIG